MIATRYKAADWQVLSSEPVFEGWFNVRRDRLRLPDGGEMDYSWVDGRSAAAVLAFTPDRHVIVNRQYRHPQRRIIWDLPAGLIEPGEEPIDAARRELREETGYSADRLEPLGCVTPSSGLLSAAVHYFVAHEVEPGERELDATEFIEVQTVEWGRIVEHVMSDGPVDGTLAHAVLRYLAGEEK